MTLAETCRLLDTYLAAAPERNHGAFLALISLVERHERVVALRVAAERGQARRGRTQREALTLAVEAGELRDALIACFPRTTARERAWLDDVYDGIVAAIERDVLERMERHG